MRKYLEGYWHIPVFIVAALIAFKLRILNPWNSVFTWTVRLGGNDPWYYYRLIENCIHNFPYRIWFDPFTHYPYGTYTHFGPFLVYLGSIAGIIFGATSGEALRAVLAFIPAIGGILAIFPVYFLTKEVFDKKTAAIAAFIVSFVPGQFLQRSLLGFNDHHIWEVFWMVTTLAAYTYALNRWVKSDNWRNKNNLVLSVIAGLAFGLYLYSWVPGFVLSLVILMFIYLSIILKKYLNFNENVVVLTAVMFIVTALVYLPFAFNTPYFANTKYSPFQLIFLLAVSAVSFILWLLDRNYVKIQKYLRVPEYQLLIAIAILAVISVPILTPELYRHIASILRVIQPKGGSLTVAEVYPFFFTHAGEFTLSNALYNFGIAFFPAMGAFVYSVYRIYKNRSVTEFAVLVWAVAMFIALCGQNRFAYYFGAVVAVYSALALDFVFSKLHLYSALENLVRKSKTKFGYIRVILAILIALAVVYPTYSIADMESQGGGGPVKQWYDALVWFGNNTPDKEKYDEFYYKLYKPTANIKEPYSYPFETYGVLSWWDYGHWIESIAHRMPIANPFQQGIGNKYNNVPGASSFLTAFNESEAERIAEKLNVKYVISDLEMATGKFYAIAVWAEGDLPYAEKYYHGYAYISKDGMLGFSDTQWEIPVGAVVIPMRIPSKLYYMTMEARLHIFDGIGLRHYRLIYESEPATSWQSILKQVKERNITLKTSDIVGIAARDAYYRAVYGVTPSLYAQETLIKFVYKRFYERQLGIPLKSLAPSGYVKIFERVKGARIVGKVPENVNIVRLNVTIKTNQNRTFDYILFSKVKNGTYEFTVPYAQDTTYAVKPVTAYHIRAGKLVKTLEISEEQVLNGETVRVDLI